MSDPRWSDLEEAKLLSLFLLLFLGPLGLTANTVQIFTCHASQTHMTIHIPKAHDTYYPLTCYTQRRRDNFPGTQFFLDKLLILKKGLGQGTPKQLAELKKKSEFFDGSLSPSGNRPLGEKALSGQMLLELNLSLPFPCV